MRLLSNKPRNIDFGPRQIGKGPTWQGFAVVYLVLRGCIASMGGVCSFLNGTEAAVLGLTGWS